MILEKKKWNMLFLGERSIASGAIKLFLECYRSDTFELKAIVSSREFYDKNIGFEIRNDIVFISNERNDSQALLTFIKNNSINLLFSIQHNWIIPPEVIDGVGPLCFNLHNAKLPEYKGFNSITHAILNGDKEYTSTIHWMTEDVDSGAIAFEASIPINVKDTAKSLHNKTIDLSLSLVVKLFDSIKIGSQIPKTPQTSSIKGVFHKRDSVKQLLEVDITQDINQLNKQIRATYYPPYNNAFFITNGLKINLIPDELD